MCVVVFSLFLCYLLMHDCGLTTSSNHVCFAVKSCFYWFVFLGLFFVPFFCVDVGLEKMCLTLEVIEP